MSDRSVTSNECTKGHLRLFECAGLPEGKYIERKDCLLCEIEWLRALVRDSRQSIKKAANADCVCEIAPQRCKYCASHRAILDRIDITLSGDGSQVETKKDGWKELHQAVAKWSAHESRFQTLGPNYTELNKILDAHNPFTQETSAPERTMAGEDISHWWKCPNCHALNDPVTYHTSCPWCRALKPSENGKGD